MKGILFKGIFLFTLLILLNRCYYDSEEYLYPELGVCDTSNITFSVSVKNVLADNSCISCHSNISASSSGGNIKLQDYADVKKYADNGSLMGSILHKPGYTAMPESGGSMSICGKTIIQKWIDAQTPNN